MADSELNYIKSVISTQNIPRLKTLKDREKKKKQDYNDNEKKDEELKNDETTPEEESIEDHIVDFRA